MRFHLALSPLLTATALAACSQEAADQTPAPTPSLTTQALPTQAADGSALTAGEWLIEETGSGASARFAEKGGADALALVCDRANRTLSLSRAGTAAQPQRFRITAGAQKADAMMAPGGALGLSAAVDGSQPIFVAFADPAGVIELTGPGAAALRVPGHPGIGRVLAACA